MTTPAVSVHFHHVPEFDKALDEMVKRALEVSRTALIAATEVVKKEVTASFGSGNGPVSRSGRLAKATTGTEPKRVGGLQRYETTIGPTGLEYIRKVELGKHNPHGGGPHPYFKPGYTRAGATFHKVFRDAWLKAIVK